MEQPGARCASCEAELTDGARFCNRCGTAVEGSGPANDDPTGEIAMPDADAPTALITPDFESLAATHLIESFDTDQLERTARSMTVDGTALDAPLVWGDADRPFDDTIDDTPVSGISIEPDTTSALARGADDPTPVTPTARMQTPTAPTPLFRPTVMTAIGAVSVVALLVALTADIIAIETTAGPAMAEVADSIGLRTGIWHLGDLASNVTVAGLLAAIGLAIGAVASAMGRSWGSGLIGGSGLSGRCRRTGRRSGRVPNTCCDELRFGRISRTLHRHHHPRPRLLVADRSRGDRCCRILRLGERHDHRPPQRLEPNRRRRRGVGSRNRSSRPNGSDGGRYLVNKLGDRHRRG